MSYRIKKIIYIFISLLLFSFFCFGIGYSLNIDIKNTPNLSLDFWTIFLNNLKVNIMAIIYSLLSIGIYSFIYLAKEMFFLGVIVKSLEIKHSLFYALSFIGCHGIIEIPAIILSGTIGLYIWINIIACFKNKKYDFKIVPFLFGCLFIMIFIAALIESFITPWFLRKYVI